MHPVVRHQVTPPTLVPAEAQVAFFRLNQFPKFATMILAVCANDRVNCNLLGRDLIGPHFKADQGIGPKRLGNRDVSSVTSLSN
jgi:hypothetical protein